MKKYSIYKNNNILMCYQQCIILYIKEFSFNIWIKLGYDLGM